METVKIRACQMPICPSVEMTGKDIAKAALAVTAVFTGLYLLSKVK